MASKLASHEGICFSCSYELLCKARRNYITGIMLVPRSMMHKARGQKASKASRISEPLHYPSLSEQKVQRLLLDSSVRPVKRIVYTIGLKFCQSPQARGNGPSQWKALKNQGADAYQDQLNQSAACQLHQGFVKFLCNRASQGDVQPPWYHHD